MEKGLNLFRHNLFFLKVFILSFLNSWMKTNLFKHDDTKNMPFSLSALQSYALLKEIPTVLNVITLKAK